MRVPSTTSRPQLCQLEYIYVGCFLFFGTYVKTFKPFSGREITDLDRIPSPTYHPQWSNVTSEFLFLIRIALSRFIIKRWLTTLRTCQLMIKLLVSLLISNKNKKACCEGVVNFLQSVAGLVSPEPWELPKTAPLWTPVAYTAFDVALNPKDEAGSKKKDAGKKDPKVEPVVEKEIKQSDKDRDNESGCTIS